MHGLRFRKKLKLVLRDHGVSRPRKMSGLKINIYITIGNVLELHDNLLLCLLLTLSTKNSSWYVYRDIDWYKMQSWRILQLLLILACWKFDDGSRIFQKSGMISLALNWCWYPFTLLTWTKMCTLFFACTCYIMMFWNIH